MLANIGVLSEEIADNRGLPQIRHSSDRTGCVSTTYRLKSLTRGTISRHIAHVSFFLDSIGGTLRWKDNFFSLDIGHHESFPFHIRECGFYASRVAYAWFSLQNEALFFFFLFFSSPFFFQSLLVTSFDNVSFDLLHYSLLRYTLSSKQR